MAAADRDWYRDLLVRRRDIPTEALRDKESASDLDSGWDSAKVQEMAWAERRTEVLQSFGKRRARCSLEGSIRCNQTLFSYILLRDHHR